MAHFSRARYAAARKEITENNEIPAIQPGSRDGGVGFEPTTSSFRNKQSPLTPDPPHIPRLAAKQGQIAILMENANRSAPSVMRRLCSEAQQRGSHQSFRSSAVASEGTNRHSTGGGAVCLN
jgi:hypothetical protein